jgi:poly-gamma-glutamate synthesis protein (capsule biosynthesis protein)
MIFCGDFVYPFHQTYEFSIDGPDEFLQAHKVINFECSLEGTCNNETNAPIPLISSPYSVDILSQLNCKVVCLANNHTFDYEPNLDDLFRTFNNKSILPVGAGKNLSEAAEYVQYENFIIMNFGWDVIGCKKARKSRSGCNPVNYEHVLTEFKLAKNKNPLKKIVVVFHWGYEFEIYPMPAHRELCRVLSSLGAHAIICHHAHVILGCEYFGNTPVFYGLGNFFMPKFNFSGYVLDYPVIAKTGLAVDVFSAKLPRCYFVTINESNALKVHDSISVDELITVTKSEFLGLSNKDYIDFFKNNRIKTKGLPVYEAIDDSVFVKDYFVYLRQIFIDTLVKLKLK